MILFFSSAALVLILDQISKHIVASSMELGSSIPVIKGVFELTYIRNTGAAWGILEDKQLLLQIFTALLMAGIVIYAVVSRKKMTRWELLSLGLILGGGLGNFVSRVIYGYVVDFFNIQIIPVFNMADIGITVGCAILVIVTLLSAKTEKPDGQ